MSFVDGERALCFHGPLMYECKVTKAAIWDATNTETGELGPHYLVHYKGWKQTWDEWVSEDRLKKHNEENLKKQKALIEAQRARDQAERIALAKANEAELSRKTGAPSGMGGLGGGGGMGNGNGISGSGLMPSGAGRRDEKRGAKRPQGDGEDEYMKRPEIKISIPDELKSQLVDEWENITKKSQLVRLPREPSVDTILDEWNKYHQNEEPDTKRLTAEVSAGLRLYFNKALGNNLLYRFERGQYAEMMKRVNEEEIELSSIYGAEHLLRLFVNLPELLAHTTMDPETVTTLKEQMAAFLRWMNLNAHMLFDPNGYDNTPSGYMNNNRP